MQKRKFWHIGRTYEQKLALVLQKPQIFILASLEIRLS